MDIRPFQKEHLSDAAALFAGNVKRLRQQVPILPASKENPAEIMGRLEWLTETFPCFVALDSGRVVGYLGALVADEFRGTERRAAYCPEWGHAAPDNRVYGALYRAASEQWANAGCNAHAVTLLAHDQVAERSWFWNGFGLTVVDAIRSMTPVQAASPEGYEVRQANSDDARALSELESEHWEHYTLPPMFMADRECKDAAAFAAFIDDPKNNVWIANQGSTVMAYVQFEGSSDGGASVLESDTRVAITAAYTRAAYRGRGAAVALLNAGLAHYIGLGIERCSVDFESFNPEASAFWMKYFQPVCYSLIRVPERALAR